MDCTSEVDLCRANVIQAFPSIRVFRKGHDELNVGGHTVHEAYTGDRTKEALVAFAEGLLPSAGACVWKAVVNCAVVVTVTIFYL